MASDLERRIAFLERGVRVAFERAAKLDTAISRTTSTLISAPREWPPPSPPASTSFPCCGASLTSNMLTLVQPDGSTVPLPLVWESEGARQYSNTTIVYMYDVPNGQYVAPYMIRVRLQYNFYCRKDPSTPEVPRLVVTGSGAYAWRYIDGAPRDVYWPMPDNRVVLMVLSHRPEIDLSASSCSPFHAEFEHVVLPHSYSWFRWSDMWLRGTTDRSRWIIYGS